MPISKARALIWKRIGALSRFRKMLTELSGFLKQGHMPGKDVKEDYVRGKKTSAAAGA